MNNKIRLAALLSFTLIVTACGGGGGGGSDASPAQAPAASGGGSAPPSTPVATGTTVTGSVTKGPVVGAILEVYNLDQFGQLIGDPVATGTTTADGNFSITIPDNAGILIVVARGGSFIDESDQEPVVANKRQIQLQDDQSFLSFLEDGQTAVAVTPFTTAVVTRARLLGGPDGTFIDKLAAAKAAMNGEAGFDIFTTIPTNPVAPDAAATDAQKQYALLLGGLANLANTVAIELGRATPTYEDVVAITFDLVDGQLDGRYFGLADVPNGSATPTQLPTNTSFADAVVRFRNNNFDAFGDTLALPSIEVAGLGNTAPTADAGVDIPAAPTNSTVQLNGAASSDPESGLFFSWTQVPGGTAVTLDNANIATPSFTAPDRLLGNETLTFELTVIDPIGLFSVDTVSVEVVGSLPTKFYVSSTDDQGDGVGVNVDGGALLTFDLAASTGTLLDDAGTVSFGFTADTATDIIALNFATPFVVDDFDDRLDTTGDGVPNEDFLIEEQADLIELTLLAGPPQTFSIREVGNRVFTPIDPLSTSTIPSEPYQFIDPAQPFDPAQANPFVINIGDQRTLFVNSASTFPLPFNDELQHDIFTFETATTGTTVKAGLAFNYSVDAVTGALQVDFPSTNDSASYINLTTIPTGDLVAAEFTLDTPIFPDDDSFIGEVFLSIPVNPASVQTTLADIAGIYTGTVDDERIDDATLALRLNPDGTGSLNFDAFTTQDPRFVGTGLDEQIIFRSNFGVCWELDADNNIVVNREFSLNASFPNTFSSETDTAFCSSLLSTPDEIDFQFVLTQLDNDGTLFKTLQERSTNRCFNTPAADCATPPPGLDLTGFELRITTKVPLTARPPIAGADGVQTPDATAVTIDAAANDVQGDLAIDLASVTLLKGPFFGTVTAPDASGIFVYTPNPGIERDIINYTISDSAGNPSQVQVIEIVINPCESINGQQAFFDSFSGDCDYSGLAGAANVVTNDITFGALPNGGMHKFDDSLIIGDDFNTDAALLTAGISQGGDGQTMTVGPGAILGFNNPAAVISISRGSQLFVGGTPTEPAVFTSQNDIFSKRDIESGGPGFQEFDATQQWGGVVIQGFGVTNACSYSGNVPAQTVIGECHAPSPAGFGHYGGNNNADNSGAINYLQIKHSGGVVNAGEAAGISLQAVGSTTAISHLEVYSSFADGLQLLGGAVDVNNYLGLYVSDTALAFDEGFRGTLSNLLLVQAQNSGVACMEGSGIFDFEILMLASISATISQGLNSQPTISNVTCIVSSSDLFVAPDDFGAGFEFDRGAFPTFADGLVIAPGQDNAANTNFCFHAADESEIGLENGDLTVSSTIFACPDGTENGLLPNLGITQEQFLASNGGNQFANLFSGSSNPAPVASAATGNVLLEGTPLIYAVDVASATVDGSPTSVAPTGTFVGGVRLVDDWTQDWTFGLHDGLRTVPLWYETPIVSVVPSIPASKNQTVTLNASQTVANTPGVTYQWTQIGGPPVTLSNPTSLSTTFTSPGAGTNLTVPGGILDFEFIATDDNGLQGKGTTTVFVDAQIPLEFFAVQESIIPFLFNQTIEDGQLFSIDPNTNTGTYTDQEGPVAFSWSDDATTFTVDFTGTGGLISQPQTTFEDVNMDTVPEEVQVTQIIDQFVYTLVADNGPKKQFTRAGNGLFQKFDVTNSAPLADVLFTNFDPGASTEAIVSTDVGVFIDLFGGVPVTLSALADISATNPTLANPSVLTLDELTFDGFGSGFALRKGESFTYFPVGPSELGVNFLNGDTAVYSVPFNALSGNASAVKYTRAADAFSIAEVTSGLLDQPLTTWQPGTVDAGVYTNTGREQLDDGSFVSVQSFYRLHPDGTGQLELESVDPVSGVVNDIFTSSRGICWFVDGSQNLVINRVPSADEIVVGSSVPSPSTCSIASTDNSFIDFQRTHKLFDILGEFRTVVENRENQCFIDPMTCDPSILELRDVFQRNFDTPIPLFSNPPLASTDFPSATEGTLASVDVVSNDQAGDAPIDPLTVFIVVPPQEGIANVDPATGNIEYTPNVGHSGFDQILYRVLDLSGNESTIGRVIFSVSP